MPKVYKFRKYDISSDETITSRRWATREAIKAVCGEVVEDTETEIDASFLDNNGMTERNFEPHKREGFQREIK